MTEGRWRIHRRQNTLPTQIGTAGLESLTVTPTGIVTAAPTAFVTTSLSFSDGVRTQTVVNTFSSSAATTDDNARSTTSSTVKSTSTATSDGSKTSSSNLGTLIPAIVAPVAAILVISFVVFWFFMRRRQKKAMKNEPEFVMEGMKEKQHNRPITADSNSSTQELVPNKNKDAAVHVREMERSGPSAFAPPGIESTSDSRPGSRQATPTGNSKSIPNFSRGPRPNTAGRDAPSPAPGFGPRERGGSRDGPRPPPGSAGPRPNGDPRGPPPRPHPPRTGSFSRPLPSGTNKPPPVTTYTAPNNFGPDGKVIQPPAGAYNGSSPISQYSPIVKDMPKFGTSPMVTATNTQSRPGGGSISSINDQGIRKPPPSAIKTTSSPLSPMDPKFSEENVRIARLANNPRPAFHSMVATTAATSPATEEPPTPSPRLPPPATRDAPPINYNIPLPAIEPPAPASIQARLNGTSISDRRSVISGLSDDYVDMEVDNKSDVSSMDEREKWQMQSDNEQANTRQAGLNGYGGLGPRPPLLSADAETHSSNASTSQYSLGYYKDGPGPETR